MYHSVRKSTLRLLNAVGTSCWTIPRLVVILWMDWIKSPLILFSVFVGWSSSPKLKRTPLKVLIPVSQQEPSICMEIFIGLRFIRDYFFPISWVVVEFWLKNFSLTLTEEIFSGWRNIQKNFRGQLCEKAAGGDFFSHRKWSAIWLLEKLISKSRTCPIRLRCWQFFPPNQYRRISFNFCAVDGF